MGCCCSSEGGDGETKNITHEPKSSESAHISYGRKRHKESEREKPAVYFVALWDYKKSCDAELSFNKGDVFKEFGGEQGAGPDWMFVTQEGKSERLTTTSMKGGGSTMVTGSAKGGSMGTGYIPKNYVARLGSVEAEDFWFADILRIDAEALLKNRPDGTFLVRGREADSGNVEVLSVAFHGKTMHYRLNRHPEKLGRHTVTKYSIGSRRFDSIRDLVKWFQTSTEGGICCVLTESPPRPPPPKSAISAEVEKHWREIPRHQIHINSEIGKGFFAVVHKGTWEPTQGVRVDVAIKELKRGITGGREEFLREAMTMKNLVHERLVKMHGVVSADEPFLIITEFVKEGSLKSYLKRRAKENRLLNEKQLVEIAKQVAEGMRYMESKHAVHRDLAARNVLIQEVDQSSRRSLNFSASQEFDVKIADFGLAAMIKRGESLQERRSLNLPTKWTAPEALMTGRFSPATDVWSFGILLHEIFTHGSDPYQNMSMEETRRYVLEEHRQMKKAPEVPEMIFALISNCCDFAPVARPKFTVIVTFLETYFTKESHYDPYCKPHKNRDRD